MDLRAAELPTSAFEMRISERQIAEDLGCAQQTVINQLVALGKKAGGSNKSKPESDRRHEAKVRKCLKCRNEFDSAWSGQRICGPCKGSSEYNLPSQWAGVA